MGPANAFKKEPIGGETKETGIGLLKREMAKITTTVAIYQDYIHQTLQPKLCIGCLIEFCQQLIR